MDQDNQGSTISAILDRVWQGLFNLLKEPAFYVYVISAVIYLPWFMPNLSDIAPWDETYHVISGRDLLSGHWPNLAYGPLLSFFSMLCYLPFRGSPFWLIHSNSLGRFLLFSLNFLGAWHVAKAMKDQFKPIIMFGFLFLTPLLIFNFEYPADLLFGALSALAFAQVVHFLKTKEIKHLWWASFWLGLGMLTRGDAMIIMGALTLLVVILGCREHKWWRLILASLVPFLALTVGFVLLRGVVTGNFDTGMDYRSYVAFEQGQEVDLPSADGRFDAPTESFYVARELFGTAEENQYSVFRAIGRNPSAYLSRLVNVIKLLPGLFLTAYYRRYTIFLSLLALRGLISLFERKLIPLALLHLIWALPLSAGIARTLVRVGYFRLFYFVLFSLAIIGLQTLLERLQHTREGLIWGGLMLLVLALALRQGDQAIQFGMTIFLCWLLLAHLLSRRSAENPQWQYLAMLLLFSGGILLKGAFLIYTPRVLGQEPREQASLALREVTRPDDYVLTCTPSVVFLADRQVANFCSANIPVFESSTQFIDWMAVQDFKAIYLERIGPALLWDLTFDQIGVSLTQVFVSDGEEAYIFLLDTGD